MPMTLAGTKAVNCVALTKVVASTELTICTVAPDTNPVPFIVRVKPALPAVTELGFSEVMLGFGGPMVKITLLETIPPDSTVTVPVPGKAYKLVGARAVNWVELTKVVPNTDPFH